MNCSKCGSEVMESDNFCLKCGAKLKDTCNCWVKKIGNYTCGECNCPGYGLHRLEKKLKAK